MGSILEQARQTAKGIVPEGYIAVTEKAVYNEGNPVPHNEGVVIYARKEEAMNVLLRIQFKTLEHLLLEHRCFL